MSGWCMSDGCMSGGCMSDECMSDGCMRVQKTSSNTPVHRIERLVEMTDTAGHEREMHRENLTRDLWY